jgi:hypothetical protein
MDSLALQHNFMGFDRKLRNRSLENIVCKPCNVCSLSWKVKVQEKKNWRKGRASKQLWYIIRFISKSNTMEKQVLKHLKITTSQK